MCWAFLPLLPWKWLLGLVRRRGVRWALLGLLPGTLGGVCSWGLRVFGKGFALGRLRLGPVFVVSSVLAAALVGFIAAWCAHVASSRVRAKILLERYRCYVV
jgi:hypothetical protein